MTHWFNTLKPVQTLLHTNILVQIETAPAPTPTMACRTVARQRWMTYHQVSCCSSNHCIHIVHTFSGRGHTVDFPGTQLRWYTAATDERVHDLCASEASSGLCRQPNHAHWRYQQNIKQGVELHGHGKLIFPWGTFLQLVFSLGRQAILSRSSQTFERNV